MKKFIAFLTGFVVAVALTLGLELLFALIVKACGLDSNVIRPVNQVIKAICILVAVFLGVREKGIVFGAIMGLTYSVATNIIFGLIGGNLAFDISFFLDLLFGSIIGLIGGIIRTNLKSN